MTNHHIYCRLQLFYYSRFFANQERKIFVIFLTAETAHKYLYKFENSKNNCFFSSVVVLITFFVFVQGDVVFEAYGNDNMIVKLLLYLFRRIVM